MAIANASLEMLNVLGIDKNEKILVCRGYCNSLIPKILYAHGYTNVSTGVIGEPLQTSLEDAAWKHIESLGYGSYYDPKGMSKAQIGKSFADIIKWIVKNDKISIAKTGWNFFKEGKQTKYL